MSFGSQSIRSEPSLGADISPTAQSVPPIGPFLGSAGGALNQHSMTGDGPIFGELRSETRRWISSSRYLRRPDSERRNASFQEVKVCKGDPVVGETGIRRN